LIKNNISSIENLEIKYSGENVENLSITKFAFWNAGRETIRKNDFINNDELSIQTSDDILIYDYKIELEDERNNFKVIQIEKALLLKFDFLDKNEGILMTIYHSGTKSSDIKIKGSFMGSNKIKKGYEREKLSSMIENSFILKFVGYLLQNKYIILKILGFFLTLIILMPYIFVLLLPARIIDYIYDNFFNKCPEEFHFNDEKSN